LTNARAPNVHPIPLPPSLARPPPFLFFGQVEFCDTIVISKSDLIGPTKRDELAALLQSLNPAARVLVADYQSNPPVKAPAGAQQRQEEEKKEGEEEREAFGVGFAELVGGGRAKAPQRFDFEAAESAPGWLRELRGEHVPESEEYGIKSLHFEARRPFHPMRLWDVLEPLVDSASASSASSSSSSPRLLRSKGMVWLASRPDGVGDWSQAGADVHFDFGGTWYAAQPESEWPSDPEELEAEVRAPWLEPFGDRRQALVLIGQRLDPAAITEQLEAALLDDAELESYSQATAELEAQGAGAGDAAGALDLGRLTIVEGLFEDPFPEWAWAEPDEQQEEEN